MASDDSAAPASNGDASASNGSASKAGDWQNYERVLLPPVEDLHRLEVYEEHGGYRALKKVLTSEKWTREKVTQEVKESGLKGRGGAGFSTGMKWSFMPDPGGRHPRYLCLNADESEPGTFKDRQLLEYNPHLMLEGVLIACYAMAADACYVYFRGEYVDWLELMGEELEKLYEKGYVGEDIMGSDFSADIYLHKGAGAYICGEETGLMESLEGKRGYPRTKPPFPAQKGVWGQPTTINNVETIACVPLILDRGADWFSNIGAPDHTGPILYGISGHVERPGVYEYPSGMLISDLIYEVAGGMRNGKDLKAVVPGGSSVPILRADMIDGVTMDSPSLRDAGSLIGTAGMLILDEDTDMVAFLRRVAHFYRHESCGQCTPCRDGTGWMEKILRRIEVGEGRTRDLDLLLEICDNIEGGRTICALADGAAWPVRNTIQRFRDEFEARCQPDSVPVEEEVAA